jgi:hypothetical protein
MADGTQFLIDIATKLSGAQSSASQLADLGDRMARAGSTSAELEAATKAASIALEESAASVAAASTAFAAAQAAYSSSEVGADRAAKAVERLGQQIIAQQNTLKRAMDAPESKGAEAAAAKLRNLVARQQELTSRAEAAKTALAAEATALDKLKASASAAADKHAALGKGMGNLKSATSSVAGLEKAAKGTGQLGEMAGALGQLGGPLGAIGQKAAMLGDAWTKLGKTLGAAGPYAAAAVAIVAIATAAIVATVAIIKFGVNMADAARNAALVTAGLAASSAGLAAASGSFRSVSRATGMATAEVQKLAVQLDSAKISAADMPDALRAVATATAGGASAAYLAQLNDELKAGKTSASALAAEVDKKFGGIVAKKMLSLDAQSARLKGNFGEIFGGLKIEGLLEGMSKLVALFDANTASGRALKFLFETFAQPLVDSVVAAIPVVERLFLQSAILAMKAYIALQPFAGVFKFIATSVAMLAALIGGLLVAAIGVVVVSLALFAAPFVVAIMAIRVVIDGVIAGLNALGSLAVWAGGMVSSAFGSIMDFFGGLDLVGVAGDLIAGLARGIAAGAGAVISAITGVVGGAIDAAKSLLGIASPSKVFAGIGDFTAQGFADGVDDGSSAARSSLESMVSPPDVEVGKAGGSGGGNTINLTINVTGGDSAHSIAAAVRTEIITFFEGTALQLAGT